MATSYSVFIKMQAQGASKTASDIKKVENSSTSASVAADTLSKTLGILTASLGVAKIVQANDAWITFTNTLKATGLAGDQLLKFQESLFEISQQTNSSIEGTANIYRALSTTVGEAGASEEDLLTVTKALNEGIVQSGASAQQAQGGIIQLSQVFEKGKLQAQEYNSIVSDFPALGNLLRQAFLQASGGAETFRQQMDAGKITSEAFFNALKVIAPELDKTQSSMQQTTEQGVTALSNSFEKLVGSISQFAKTNSLLQSVFDSLAQNIDNVSDSIIGLNRTMNASDSGFGDYVKSITKVLLATNPLSAVFSSVTDSLEGYIDGFQTASEKNKEFADSLSALNNISPIAKNLANIDTLLGRTTASIDAMKSASDTGSVFFSQEDLNSITQAEDNLNQLSPVMTKVKVQAVSMGTVFEQSFAGSFGSAVAGIVTGSESASEAFTQMANSIISDMIRIGIERATLAAFSSIGGWLSGAGAATSGASAASSAAIGPVAPVMATAPMATSPVSMLSPPLMLGASSIPPTMANKNMMGGNNTTLNINTTVNNTSDIGDGQKYAIRTYLQATNYGTPEEIEDEIISLEDRGELEKKANQFKPKLDNMQQQIVNQQIAAQQQAEMQRHQQSEMYRESVYTTLESGELNGVKLGGDIQNMLYAGLVQPNYPSASGRQTNLLGHLLEKYQWIEPDHSRIAEVLWLLADRDSFMSELQGQGASDAQKRVARTLKTEQQAAHSGGGDPGTSDDDGGHRQPQKRKGVPRRPRGDFFRR